MKRVTVLGSGSWGTALARLLDKNGHAVNMWSYKKEEAESIIRERENKEFLPGILLSESIKVTNNAESALKNAELIVTAVPSNASRKVIKDMAGFFPKGAIIVNVSKGLDEGTLLRLSQVFEELLPHNHITVLSGPSHAEEVARDIPTTCVAASNNLDYAKLVQDAFINDFFRVYTNKDIIGIEIGGALKNVMALAAGISDGLGFGDNTKAALMTRGIREIARLGVKMGADIHTFSGLSGIGDLIVTCTSMHSRNRRAGILLGQGKKLDQVLEEVHMVVEGVPTAKAAYELSVKYDVSMPITTEVYNILFKDKPARDTVLELMTRDKTMEV